MGRISELERRIYDIGSRMVRCTEVCAGINLNVEAGILPRCLILEADGRVGAMGSVIVGMNPGKSRVGEREFYRTHGQTYEQTAAYWNECIGFRHKYYESLRELADQLGLTGPILWTELVKCENAENGEPPLQTFRTCMRKYLCEELNLIPKDWPLIGAGKQAYKALAYRYPSRIVIGVPHPTGSFGHFPKLFDDGDQLHCEFKLSFDDLWDGTRGKAIWRPDNAT